MPLQSKSGTGWVDGKGCFLIDGFPREMDQVLKFKEDVRSQPSRLPFKTNSRACMLINRAMFPAVPVVRDAVLQDGRGEYVEAPVEKRRD